MAINPNDVVDKIMARLPNAGNPEQNNEAKENIKAIVEEILNEVVANGVINTTVTGTDSQGGAIAGTGVGTIS